jgi:hypothetical protein
MLMIMMMKVVFTKYAYSSIQNLYSLVNHSRSLDQNYLPSKKYRANEFLEKTFTSFFVSPKDHIRSVSFPWAKFMYI